MVEVLSIQKLHTVSPELKIKRPLLRESTFRIINITLPVRLLFHQEKWHSLSYRILSFLENEGSPISSLVQQVADRTHDFNMQESRHTRVFSQYLTLDFVDYPGVYFLINSENIILNQLIRGTTFFLADLI